MFQLDQERRSAPARLYRGFGREVARLSSRRCAATIPRLARSLRIDERELEADELNEQRRRPQADRRR
jgi:hypothetical protein